MADTGASVTEQARLIRQAILERHGYGNEEALPDSVHERAIEDAAGLATVTSHWGITSTAPVVGPAVVLIRRVLRIGLRWYINPIVEQQNAFNDATVRALYELQSDIDKLRDVIAADQKSAHRE
jgi:hypothetical protein